MTKIARRLSNAVEDFLAGRIDKAALQKAYDETQEERGVGRTAEIDRQSVLELWQNGEHLSQAEIARRLEYSANGVRMALIELGDGSLPPRDAT